MSQERERSIWVWTQLGRETVRCGTLFVVAGGRRLSFRYRDAYLERTDAYQLDPALPLGAGTMPMPHGGISGTFSDSAPDRWGRELIRRQHGGSVDDLDVLLGVDDRLRMGALRYTTSGSDAFLAADHGEPVPPLIDLAHLQSLADQVQADPAFAQLRELARAGSSLGGARPKVNVRKPDGTLAIAKFSSKQDDFAVIAWEAVTHQLAADAGIYVPKAMFRRIGSRPVLITDRFDREPLLGGTDRRIPYMSAMTRLRSHDGAASTFAEIAEVTPVRADRHELFRRAAFGLAVNNTDDHLRNHGFLLKDGQWRLSPAFDINPSRDSTLHATAVSPLDENTLTGLIRSAELFDLKGPDAERIIDGVRGAVAGWETTARRFGLNSDEIRAMAPVFTRS
jgi:serine/threonine-protein kinase HipA